MPTSALAGTRIRERRLSLGLKQGAVADLAGISASYLNLIEHNRRNVTPEVLTRLACARGVDRQATSAKRARVGVRVSRMTGGRL